MLLRGLSIAERILHEFFDFEAKSCSQKNAPKNVPKNAPKNGMFSPNFSTKIFPEFLVCVCFSAVRAANATEKRPPKNSARKSIAAQSKIQSADVVGGEASQHAHLRSKNYPEKPIISSARSSAPLCLPKCCIAKVWGSMLIITWPYLIPPEVFYAIRAHVQGVLFSKGGGFGTFWKPPSENPFGEPFSK